MAANGFRKDVEWTKSPISVCFRRWITLIVNALFLHAWPHDQKIHIGLCRLFAHPLASVLHGGAHECASPIFHCWRWPGRLVPSAKLLFSFVKAGDESRKCLSGMWESHIQSFMNKFALNIVLVPKGDFPPTRKVAEAPFFCQQPVRVSIFLARMHTRAHTHMLYARHT